MVVAVEAFVVVVGVGVVFEGTVMAVVVVVEATTVVVLEEEADEEEDDEAVRWRCWWCVI